VKHTAAHYAAHRTEVQDSPNFLDGLESMQLDDDISEVRALLEERGNHLRLPKDITDNVRKIHAHEQVTSSAADERVASASPPQALRPHTRTMQHAHEHTHVHYHSPSPSPLGHLSEEVAAVTVYKGSPRTPRPASARKQGVKQRMTLSRSLSTRGRLRVGPKASKHVEVCAVSCLP
jgi:hypothetical protein